MLIKITELNDELLGKFDAKEVKGTRVDSGEEWSKKFFANNLKLAAELAEFGIGETINVKMKQNGKFWDITGFELANEAMIAKVQGQGNAGGGYNKPADGGGGAKKAAWTPDPNKDRGVSLRYAIDTMIATTPDKNLKLMNVLDFTQGAKEFMDIYVDLMQGKDPFGRAEDAEDGDGLEPPAI